MLVPYLFIAVLAVIVVVDQIGHWQPDRSVVVLGVLLTMIVPLTRQLVMIGLQRRRTVLEQRGIIATVSHELRTPLTAVVGILEVLEEWDAFDDAEKQDMVGVMRGQAHVMARVVGDLVAVARSEM